MTELHSVRAELLSDAWHVEPPAPRSPSSLTLSAQPSEDVWIAHGQRLKWRVVSEFRSFGEWDVLADAIAFMHLLLDGNPNLRRLA